MGQSKKDFWENESHHLKLSLGVPSLPKKVLEKLK